MVDPKGVKHKNAPPLNPTIRRDNEMCDKRAAGLIKSGHTGVMLLPLLQAIATGMAG